MFKSAAEELNQWADQCRRWAKGARTREQRLTLQGLERLLDDAAIEAEFDPGENAPLSPTLARRS
ncbi:MAG: hypothetical protein WA893_00020 [Xanthobacteraceae bacterium]